MSELDEIIAEIDRLAASAARIDPMNGRMEATVGLRWLKKRGVVFFEGKSVVSALVGIADDMLGADANAHQAGQVLTLASLFAKCLRDAERS